MNNSEISNTSGAPTSTTADAVRIKRGDTVFYRTGGNVIKAIARKFHRDGSVTVSACFILDAKGNSIPPFLGFQYRLERAALAAAKGAS